MSERVQNYKITIFCQAKAGKNVEDCSYILKSSQRLFVCTDFTNHLTYLAKFKIASKMLLPNHRHKYGNHHQIWWSTQRVLLLYDEWPCHSSWIHHLWLILPVCLLGCIWLLVPSLWEENHWNLEGYIGYHLYNHPRAVTYIIQDLFHK